MKRILLVGVMLAVAGCPDNPYKASTWTKKLKDPREAERAITELEQLGDPSAIPALGDAWRDEGKPPRYLQVIIALAHPLTPKEAEARFFTDFQETGRKASWDAAQPFLLEAITGVDETNPRSVESAEKAAEALGEAKLSAAIDPLAELAKKPITKKLVTAQAAAAKALGQFDNEKAKAAGVLSEIIAKEPPDDPKKAGSDKAQARLMADKLTLHLLVTDKALSALGDLRAPTAVKALALAMYRTPALFTNTRRAIVAAGPQGEEEMLKILRDQEPDVAQFIKDKRMDVYCGDDGKLSPCLKLGAKDFYPAVVIGDFYDPKVVPDLLAALKKPVYPQYYQDADSPSDSTNYSAILDALRKIGAPEAAVAVRAIWEGTPAPAGAPAAPPPPKKGAPAKPADKPAEGAPAELDIRTRTFAITVFPFVARDTAAAADLAKIADGKLTQPAGVDLQQWNAFRQEAATAFARLSVNTADIDVLNRMAQVQFDAGKKEEDKAKAEKPKYDAAEAALKAAQKAEADAQKAAMTAQGDAAIKAANEAVAKAKDATKEQKKKHKADTANYNQATANAKNLKIFAHMFQMHAARIVVAVRCKKDIACYVKTLSMKPDDAIKDVSPFVKDVGEWPKEEKQGLVDGEVERAMLELGKMGQAANDQTEKLLDAAKSDNPTIRESILLALPKIAKVPCSDCEQKLDAALRAGEGKNGIAGLQLETQMLRNYFAWAGGRTPQPKAEAADDGGGAAKPAEKDGK